MSIAVIKPQELAELCKNGKKIDLIDVRTPVEYREVHVSFARNVPLDDQLNRLGRRALGSRGLFAVLHQVDARLDREVKPLAGGRMCLHRDASAVCLFDDDFLHPRGK